MTYIDISYNTYVIMYILYTVIRRVLIYSLSMFVSYLILFWRPMVSIHLSHPSPAKALTRCSQMNAGRSWRQTLQSWRQWENQRWSCQRFMLQETQITDTSRCKMFKFVSSLHQINITKELHESQIVRNLRKDSSNCLSVWKSVSFCLQPCRSPS